MTEPTELLPCPFCGNTNAIVYDDLLTFHVGCLSCGATGSASSYRNGAISAWNRRTPQPTQAQTGAVPLTDEQIKALTQARSTAMQMAAEGRIPECGDFAAIAQNLDWLCDSFGIKGGQHGL